MRKSFNKVCAKVVTVALAFSMAVGIAPSADAAAKPKLTPAKKSIKVGKTVKLKVTAKKLKKTTWKTSSKKVAKITKKSKKAATIKGLKAGKATITAKIKAGKKTYTKKAKITVTAAATKTSSPEASASAAPAQTDTPVSGDLVIKGTKDFYTHAEKYIADTDYTKNVTFDEKAESVTWTDLKSWDSNALFALNAVDYNSAVDLSIYDYIRVEFDTPSTHVEKGQGGVLIKIMPSADDMWNSLAAIYDPDVEYYKENGHYVGYYSIPAESKLLIDEAKAVMICGRDQSMSLEDSQTTTLYSITFTNDKVPAVRDEVKPATTEAPASTDAPASETASPAATDSGAVSGPAVSTDLVIQGSKANYTQNEAYVADSSYTTNVTFDETAGTTTWTDIAAWNGNAIFALSTDPYNAAVDLSGYDYVKVEFDTPSENVKDGDGGVLVKILPDANSLWDGLVALYDPYVEYYKNDAGHYIGYYKLKDEDKLAIDEAKGVSIIGRDQSNMGLESQTTTLYSITFTNTPAPKA